MSALVSDYFQSRTRGTHVLLVLVFEFMNRNICNTQNSEENKNVVCWRIWKPVTFMRQRDHVWCKKKFIIVRHDTCQTFFFHCQFGPHWICITVVFCWNHGETELENRRSRVVYELYICDDQLLASPRTGWFWFVAAVQQTSNFLFILQGW